MTITHIELAGSQEGTDAKDRGSRAELLFAVRGSNDTAALRSYLLTNSVIPATFDGLVYRRLSWERQGFEWYNFRAEYIEPDRTDATAKLATGSTLFSFDTSGGSVTITTSRYGTTRYAKAGETAPDQKGAINVDEGEVKGTEIIIPCLKLTYRKRQPKANITTAYVKTLAGLTGTTNVAAFGDFAAGELLFLGAAGQQGTDADPEITYSFAASENVTGLTIGEIASVAKKGHEYLWVLFERVQDSAAKKTVSRPKAVYVEKVYREADWTALAI